MKKTKLLLIQLLVLTIGGIHMNAYSDENKVISGIAAKSIEVASAAFEEKLDVKWGNYITTISETNEYVIVNFHSKDIPKGFRGSPVGVPGFEVKIQKNNFKIIESQFSR